MVCDLADRGQRESEGQGRGSGPTWVAGTGRESKFQETNSAVVFQSGRQVVETGHSYAGAHCEELLAAPLDPPTRS